MTSHRVCECGREAPYYVKRLELDDTTRMVWLCREHFLDVFRPYSFGEIAVETE